MPLSLSQCRALILCTLHQNIPEDFKNSKRNYIDDRWRLFWNLIREKHFKNASADTTLQKNNHVSLYSDERRDESYNGARRKTLSFQHWRNQKFPPGDVQTKHRNWFPSLTALEVTAVKEKNNNRENFRSFSLPVKPVKINTRQEWEKGLLRCQILFTS